MSQSEMLKAAFREYDTDQVQGEVLRTLEPRFEYLQELVNEFGKLRSQPSKTLVACFYELKSTNVRGIMGEQSGTVNYLYPASLVRKLICRRDSELVRSLAA